MLSVAQRMPSPVLEYGKDPTAVLLTDDYQPGLTFCILNQLRRRNQLCDVEIRMESARLPAHKVVLAASSPYFLKLLISNSMNASEILLQDPKLDVNALEMLIEFIYSTVLRITESTVQALCYAANLLQLERIERACCKFMVKNLSQQNCIQFLCFASDHNYEKMHSQCHEYIAQHLIEVVKTSAFQTLSTSDLIAILESESLAVPSKQALLAIILDWVKHNPESRKKDLYKLLASSKAPEEDKCGQLIELLHNVSLDTAAECVFEKLKACFEKLRIHPCKDIPEPTLEEHQPKAHVEDQHSNQQMPRDSQDVESQQSVLLFAAGGNTRQSTTNSVEKYDPYCRAWVPVMSLPRKKSHAALVATDRRLYSIGGFNGTRRLPTVDICDLHTEVWTEGPAMLTPRSAFGVAVVGRTNVYCIGGYSGSQHMASVEILNLNTNKWTKGPKLQQPRSYVQAATVDDTIYAVGGTDGNLRLKSVEKLAVGDGWWSSVAGMNIPRSRPGVAVLNGLLYAVGGYSGADHLSSVECYNPKTDQWILIESMSVPRNSPAVSVIDSHLYVAGGHDGRRVTSTVEVYDPEKKQWNNAPSMQTARCDFGMAAVVASTLEPMGTWT